MGWWITLGILVLLAVLPLGVGVCYDAEGAVVKVIAGPIKITLFPRSKKEKKPKKEKKTKEKKPKADKKDQKTGKKSGGKKKSSSSSKPAAATAQKTPAPEKELPPEEKPKAEKKGGSVLDFLPLVPIVLDFLSDFRRKLRVNLLELKVVLGGGDPCDLATNYGRAWAAMGNLLPRLERFLVIQNRDLDVQCDFTASETTIYARMDLTITLGRLLAAVFVFAFRALVEFIKIIIKRKGGTEK